MSDPKSATPRTDAETVKRWEGPGRSSWVSADFARQLERIAERLAERLQHALRNYGLGFSTTDQAAYEEAITDFARDNKKEL